MGLLTSGKSIAPPHWTGHAHSGFSARPGHSILLATQNGSIILDGGISFQNIPNLFFYARGDSVSLKLASPISGSNNLLLNSEGTVQVNGNVSANNLNAFSNGDFLAGSGIITAHDVTIN